ncbi:MAG: hypothetical protein RR277_08525 [Rikenellaceae bacterium]
MKFEAGDRVEVVAREVLYETVGLLGTVLYIRDYAGSPCVGVVHDCEFRGGHTLDGVCKFGYGLRYFDAENQLVVIADDESQITADGLEALL